MKIFFYSVFILLLAPCNKPKQTTTTPVAINHSQLTITYQCTSCFGHCPTYTFSINGATKTATFNGKQNTEKIGAYTKTVTDEELTQLVNAFEKAKFTSLNDAYLGDITDYHLQ